MKTLMRRFFVRDDPEYEAVVQKYQATPGFNSPVFWYSVSR
jgi:hypothetical protein